MKIVDLITAVLHTVLHKPAIPKIYSQYTVSFLDQQIGDMMILLMGLK